MLRHFLNFRRSPVMKASFTAGSLGNINIGTATFNFRRSPVMKASFPAGSLGNIKMVVLKN